VVTLAAVQSLFKGTTAGTSEKRQKIVDYPKYVVLLILTISKWKLVVIDILYAFIGNFISGSLLEILK
jgi:hypothetical protein